MPREDELGYYGLITGQGPRGQIVERGAVEDIGLRLDNPAMSRGIATRGTLALPVAAAVDTAERAGRDFYKHVGKPALDYIEGLTGGPRIPRSRVPAPPEPTPETARPNPPDPVAPAPAAPPKTVVERARVDTSRFPYGLDLARLQAQFPTAANAPENVRNGLAARRPLTQLPARQRAPERDDSRDLQRATENVLAQIGTIPGGSGGFGDLLRYRLGLNAAAANLIPVASERARRGQAYQDAMEAYTRENELGLRLADLGLSRDRIGLAGDELDYRAYNDARRFGLDQFDSQARLALGLAELQQRDAAERLQARVKGSSNYKLFNTEAVDPETGQVLKAPNIFLGIDTEGNPIQRRLGGPTDVVDPLDELLSGVY